MIVHMIVTLGTGRTGHPAQLHVLEALMNALDWWHSPPKEVALALIEGNHENVTPGPAR